MTLSVRGLTKSYGLGEARIVVLRGVDLHVESGEMCAVMGPSGAGKSTLLHLVAGLDEPDEGTVEVLGTPLGGLDDRERTLIRRDKIGIVYQFFNLVSNLTAIENVLLPFYIADVPPDHEAAEQALERVGMKNRANHLPAQLSGGEMQLVSIARALVRKPGLVLADEPTGNLDAATGEGIIDLLFELNAERGTTLLLVTHDEMLARRCTRLVRLAGGRIVNGSGA